MSIKSEGRKVGRMIRKLTGMELPIAMKIGKRIAQSKSEFDLVQEFPKNVTSRYSQCGDGCCHYSVYTLVGKRNVSFDYGISPRDLEKKIVVNEAFAKNPGRTVSVVTNSAGKLEAVIH